MGLLKNKGLQIKVTVYGMKGDKNNIEFCHLIVLCPAILSLTERESHGGC
jgi:hypothetical protein